MLTTAQKLNGFPSHFFFAWASLNYSVGETVIMKECEDKVGNHWIKGEVTAPKGC